MTRGFYLIPLVLAAAAGALASRIEGRLEQGEFALSLDSALNRIFGSAKEALGDTLFLKANVYYHGGTAHEEEDRESLEREGLIGDAGIRPREESDWIARINDRVRSHAHHHLEQDVQKEMLPFLALSTRLDPHHVDALLTTAYWLDRHIGKTNEAIRVLEYGIEKNPESAELEFALTNLYFRRKKDYAASERHTLEAIRKGGPETFDRHERLDVYYYLGESELELGKKEEALSAFRKALEQFGPGEKVKLREIIQARIEELS